MASNSKHNLFKDSPTNFPPNLNKTFPDDDDASTGDALLNKKQRAFGPMSGECENDGEGGTTDRSAIKRRDQGSRRINWLRTPFAGESKHLTLGRYPELVAQTHQVPGEVQRQARSVDTVSESG